ncbi:hypothetical protein E2C01_032915 [Portunus trituberculatus]|uniref:Uncharacterized protein n=1 Tax=Portunus trituberculatus TaxID=210409 RepID=A0A5B7EWG9_PORTR|nr:hypothetical protein [Portunus trituberculatus]
MEADVGDLGCPALPCGCWVGVPVAVWAADDDDTDDESRQSSGSDVKEAAVEHTSYITMPRRNRKRW